MIKKIEHSYLNFSTPKNIPKGTTVVGIHKDIDDDLYELIAGFLDSNFDRIKKDTSQWFIKTEDIEQVCNAIDNYIDEQTEEESDDELIQEALKRKFKAESEGKVIEDDNVEDSEDECVLSLSRRFRHVLRELSDLKRRVIELEKQNN